MKAEKEPEEFEFGCEDLTKDWFDEISDMEEPEEKIKCDENDFFDNEQDSVEPDSKPDKARTGGIWDWDSEDYWAYGESERSLLEMAHKDMLCIAGLLEVMDSLALLADTQGLVQVEDGEEREDRQGDDLLDGLQLRRIEVAVTDAVGRDLQHVLEKGDAPADEDDHGQGLLFRKAEK